MSTSYVSGDVTSGSLWISSPSFKCQLSSAWGHLHRWGGVRARSSFSSPMEEMQVPETVLLPKTCLTPSLLILFSYDRFEVLGGDRANLGLPLEAGVSPLPGTQAPISSSPGPFHSPPPPLMSHSCPPIVEGAPELSPSSGYNGCHLKGPAHHCGEILPSAQLGSPQLSKTVFFSLMTSLVPPKEDLFFLDES